MKNIKIVIGIIILILITLGLYKFNYLSKREGYDIDGNKVIQQKKNNYLERRSMELKRYGIKIIDSEDGSGKKIKETLYIRTSDENPLKDVSISAREFWYSKFIGMDKIGIMEDYKSFKDSDFENTGELKEQFDFDILLNNVLKRVKLQPHNNSEQISILINDLKNNNFVFDNVKTMIIRVPNFEFDNSIEGFVVKYREYSVEKTPKILNAIYKKLFELNSYHGKYEGLIFNSVSIDKNKIARIMLSGSWSPVGDMSQLPFRKNINSAAFQFDTVDTVIVYLNGKIFDWCVDDQSDGEGGCNESAKYWIDNK